MFEKFPFVMMSFKIITEFNVISGQFSTITLDLLSENLNLCCTPTVTKVSTSKTMANMLHNAIRAMSLEEEEPLTLPDSPRFRVIDENERSLLGRLLNPDCQSMAKMIEYMPTAWRVYGRVWGIALSRDRFQFVFQREEDLQTVLQDRPWSYNHWTMMLERWTANPPEGFLQSMSLWIRIRNIPLIFYTAETMYKLASEVGKVEEINYDPKISQTKEYIRVMITFDVANPVKATRKLNVPSGRTVTIEFEYEKIHRRCFHCLRLTHEKIRCPLLRRGHGNDRRVIHDRVPEHSLERNRTTSMPLKGVCLEGPPGFPILFPELSPEDRKMAMLYISHSDETERLARIERVKQGIAENASESSLRLTRITKELDKGKGHIFSYTEPPLERSQKNLALTASKNPRRHDLHSDGESGSSGPHFSSQSAPNLAPTVFCLGPSSEGLTTGNVGSKKPQRRRPQAWKRRAMPKAGTRETDLSAPSSLPPSSSTKRKSVTPLDTPESKNPKFSNSTVASVLKLLPTQ